MSAPARISFEEPLRQKPRPSTGCGPMSVSEACSLCLPGLEEQRERFLSSEEAGKTAGRGGDPEIRCGRSEQRILQSCGALGGNTN